MLALLCPGQGSQTPGFLDPWLELPAAREALTTLSQASGIDLVAHGTTSDAETIRDTAIAQPLIVAAGLAAAEVLLDGPDARSAVAALSGHSVGEITAAGVGGVLTGSEAIVLVRERGLAMAEASAVQPTGMSAVVGGDPAAVAEALQRHGLTAANMNGGGQVVAAGTMDQLAALEQDAPARARVIPLSVAGAFHTEHMRPAVAHLDACVRASAPKDPWVPLISNRDGQAVDDGAQVLARIVDQVARPVRWDQVMETLLSMGVTALIELPPAGTLVGLAKRGMRGVPSVAVKTPDDLPAARALLAEHGATTSAASS